MNRREVFAAGTVTLLLATIAAQAQQTLRAGSLELTVSGGGDLQARTALSPQLLQAAELHVFDGKAKRPVALGAPTVAAQGDGRGLTFRGDSPLTVVLALSLVGRCLVWDARCANTGGEQLWLEVGPRLEFRRAGKLRFFDGWDELDAADKPLTSDRMAGNMPLTVAWTDEASLAVGLEPSQVVSYFRNEYEPTGTDTARLGCVARIVVDPGKTVQVKFVTCAAPGEWGKGEALEAYYDSFPEWFTPRPDVDPRVSMGSTQYRAWPAGGWSPEVCRRLFGGWEWCYAPFRRTGDIACRADLWDYEPARPFGNPRGKSRDEYLAWRRQSFTAGETHCDTAMMFYIPAQVWCEERLARERYADALVTDRRVKTYFDTPWCTGHDNELMVFPYGTTFEAQSHRDLRQVAAELDLSGFAFDTAGGVARYAGPALLKLDGRAWDEDVGVYCSELVSTARLMDFVHTLSKDGRKLAVVANPMSSGSYASCFHCDSAMLEANPWTNERTSSDRLRWKMGHKTLVWWEGYDVNDFVDPKTVKPDQLATVYEGLADFTLLQSLRVGYIPTPNFTQGVARLVRWLPAIVECVRTGWEPVPAARAPEPLWTSRYGRGLQTLIAVAHETGTPVTADVSVENQRLAEGALLFASYDGAALRNRLDAGETCVHVKVPVRIPVLLRALLEVQPAAAVTVGEVREEIGTAGGRLQATLDGSGEATVALRVPPGMKLTTVTWNGAPAKAAGAAGTARVQVTVGRGSRLVAQFAAELFKLSDNQLLDFPFVKDGKPNCVIAVEPGADAATQLAAFRLQEYFRYGYGRAVEPGAEGVIPIADAAAAAGGPVVRLRAKSGLRPAVSADGGNLMIVAPDGKQLHATVLKVLRALDRKYWTPDAFPIAAVRDRLAK
ncbi:MAG: hypothetical protein GW880_08795 [Armatimonadetes bacterium]|nr:hypothetical protein [Armatimonadota bacterium]